MRTLGTQTRVAALSSPARAYSASDTLVDPTMTGREAGTTRATQTDFGNVASASERQITKTAFVDGVFDIAHYGHQGVVQNAIKTASEHFGVPPEQVDVVVGVSGTDAELASYKRRSVYSIEEKMRQVAGFKGVTRVLNTPMVTTREFVEAEGIDLVVAGGDYADPEKARKYYGDPMEMGIFKTFGRTEGVSTSDLMRRTVGRVAESMQKSLGDSSEADQQTIERFLKLMKEHF